MGFWRFWCDSNNSKNSDGTSKIPQNSRYSKILMRFRRFWMDLEVSGEILKNLRFRKFCWDYEDSNEILKILNGSWRFCWGSAESEIPKILIRFRRFREIPKILMEFWIFQWDTRYSRDSEKIPEIPLTFQIFCEDSRVNIPAGAAQPPSLFWLFLK